jgi:hypothetical protein
MMGQMMGLLNSVQGFMGEDGSLSLHRVCIPTPWLRPRPCSLQEVFCCYTADVHGGSGGDEEDEAEGSEGADEPELQVS